MPISPPRHSGEAVAPRGWYPSTILTGRSLVIDVDTLAATTPQIRPARYYNNFKNGYFSRLIQPRLSPVWVVPTRHPEALSRALQAVPGRQGPVQPR